MQAKRASLKHALLIRQQKTALMGNFQLVWQTTFTNYYTAHTSQKRVTHEKRCSTGATNIVRPFLLKPYNCTGNPTGLYSLIHTLQTQQADQGRGAGGVVPIMGVMSIKWPASGTSKQPHTTGGGSGTVCSGPKYTHLDGSIVDALDIRREKVKPIRTQQAAV